MVVCWGLAHLGGCLGCDIFLLLFSDSVLHFAHNRERIHPLSCGRPLCSCVSLWLPIKCGWPDKLVWDDGLSREIRNEVFMVRGEKWCNLFPQSPLDMTIAGLKSQLVLSLFSNRDRHSCVWASRETKLLTLRLYSKNSRLFLSCNEQICACAQVKH